MVSIKGEERIFAYEPEAPTEAEWISSRWARIAQAGSGPAPPWARPRWPGLRRSGVGGGRLRCARASRSRGRGRGPGSARAASTSLDPRDRRVTLENVCQGYVLAGQVTCSRVTRRSCGPDREAPPTKNRDQKAQGHPHEKGSMSFASSQYCAIIPPPPPSTFDCGVIRHRTVEGRRRAHISS